MNVDAERALLDLAQEIGRRDDAPSVSACEAALRSFVTAVGDPQVLVMFVPLRKDLPTMLREFADRFEQPRERLAYVRLAGVTVAG